MMMRKIYYAILIAVILTVLAPPVKAQIDINVNLGSQPVWGPVGYNHVDNYYIPDLDLYYNVPQNQFYYYEKDRWVRNTVLPSRYSKYNLYNHYKVVVNEPEPWKKHKFYKNKYYSYRARHDQYIIRDSKDVKYMMLKNHPGHQNWVKQKNNENKNKDNNGNKNKSNKGNGKHKK